MCCAILKYLRLHDTFIGFSSVKCDPSEKPSNLRQIHERALAESINSSHRMKIACYMLLETLDGLDYQEFTTHIDELQIASANVSALEKHHYSRKRNLHLHHL